MKKAILSIAALAGITAAAQAQVKFAPEVGLNMTTMRTENSFGTRTTDALMGLKAGVFAELPVTNMLSVEPGIFYSMKGGQETVFSVDTKTSLSYIEVPVNLKFNFPLGAAGKVFAYAGPHFAYAVAGTYKAGNLSKDLTFGDKADDMNPLDIGAQVGAGYQLPMGLYARAQYGMGFNNLSNVSNTTTTNNSNISLSIGWQF